MQTIIFSLFNNQQLATNLAQKLQVVLGEVNIRSFPDGETYLQIVSEIKNKHIIIVDSLDNPNEKILPLIFFIQTAKDLGAKSIGLLAPYLAYMRQDQAFKPGEAVTSKHFAQLLSQNLDWLITVDPHLHRYKELAAIYTIPTEVISASSVIASWVKDHVKLPVIIGPDSESEQWVRTIAAAINAPYIILSKTRIDDSHVEVFMPDLNKYSTHTPVLVDDIISTAQTMLTVLKKLSTQNRQPPVCIGVHALFSAQVFKSLESTCAGQIFTCNTVSHPSNVIDITNLLVAALLPTVK